MLFYSKTSEQRLIKKQNQDFQNFNHVTFVLICTWLYILDKLNIFSDNSRLLVLFIPFIVYGVILFVLVPYIIQLINSKL